MSVYVQLANSANPPPVLNDVSQNSPDVNVLSQNRGRWACLSSQRAKKVAETIRCCALLGWAGTRLGLSVLMPGSFGCVFGTACLLSHRVTAKCPISAKKAALCSLAVIAALGISIGIPQLPWNPKLSSSEVKVVTNIFSLTWDVAFTVIICGIQYADS